MSFAEILARLIKKYSIDADIIIAVPISKERLRERGYNQSAIIAKKVAEFKDKNITYFKLGYLNDIFVANKHSKYIKNPLSIKDLENEVIYVPRKYAQTVERLMKLMNNKNLCLKNSSYSSILELTNKTNSIGLITKEYIGNDKLEEFDLVELETEFDLEPVEFGIYYNIDRKNEVNYLIKIIKAIFK